MGKYEINKDKAGKLHFNPKGSHIQDVLSSEAYESKLGFQSGFESLHTNSQIATVEDLTQFPYYQCFAGDLFQVSYC